ncbi:MAG: glucosamine-6-phosphate deaminase [Planctomycetaceae bacterium]|nr:glucosamine-6-phosphate deaminase [Planctomycetaceae bacterium]
MNLILTKNRNELGRYVAQAAAACLESNIRKHGYANIVVATGASQFEVLAELVRQPNVDWKKVHGFHLDEYLGLAPDHPASFCHYLQTRFVSKVPLASFHYLQGNQSTAELLGSANEALRGKSIHMALVGIGENGHLAFNDPPADFTTQDPYLMVPLDDLCRRQQVGEGWFPNLAAVPTHAISMSVRQILKAETIFCSVPDPQKAVAVRATLEEPISPAIPASILRTHDNTWLVLDEASARLLSFETQSWLKRPH